MLKSVYLSSCLLFACTSTLIYANSTTPLTTSSSVETHRFENLLHASPYTQDAGKYWTLEERMAHHKVPAVSIAVIRDGKIAWAKAYGVKQAGSKEYIDTETVFSVGSVSKVGAATLVMRLVDAGKLDLDQPVNQFLKRWKVPDNEFTAIRPVTLRGILSHSAGLSVHGFADYQPNEKLPTLVEILDGQKPAKNAAVRVQYVPGTKSQYSGGGTTVAQLAVEDITGLNFPQAASEYIFKPLNMTRSTYANPLPASYGNIAKAHNREGKPVALPRGWETMPEMAASGLWSTPTDYAKMIIALINSYQNRPNSFLKTDTARQMMTEVGISSFGIGPIMSGHDNNRVFSHSGANDSYRAWMEGNLSTGNGMVIFTNSTNGDPLFQEIKRAIELAEGWDKSTGNEKAQVQLTEKELERFAGTYAIQKQPNTLIRDNGALFSSDETGYKVALQQGNLKISFLGSTTNIDLRPMSANRFQVLRSKGRSNVEFVQGIDGQYDLIVVRNGDDAIHAIRVKPIINELHTKKYQ